MRNLRKRLTYANVLSTIAIFLALGGATAIAAKQLGKNTVGTKQLKKNAVTTAKLKKNAVTTAKIKNQAVTGAKIAPGTITGSQINLATLGTVPSAQSAQTAQTANGLANRSQFAFYIGAGTKDAYSAGPFTVRASCLINSGGEDEAEWQILTSAAGGAFDSQEGEEEEEFDPADNPVEISSDSTTTGEPDIESGTGAMLAVAPDGTTLIGNNLGVGLNIAGHPGQCFFDGTIEKLTQG